MNILSFLFYSTFLFFVCQLWYGWRYQIKPLAAAGYRVIVPDLRGFGESDGQPFSLDFVVLFCFVFLFVLKKPTSPLELTAPTEYTAYSFKTITNDLAALLDHLNVKKAVFLGHDWGGEVVWKMCLYHPQRVLAVAGVCTPFAPRLDQFIPLDQLITFLPAFGYQVSLFLFFFPSSHRLIAFSSKVYLITPEAPKVFNSNVSVSLPCSSPFCFVDSTNPFFFFFFFERSSASSGPCTGPLRRKTRSQR